MEYLNHLSKQDLISLLEAAYAIRTARCPKQFKFFFQKLKNMVLFDSILGVYIDKKAVDERRIPFYLYHQLDFSDEFLIQYVNGRFYESSSVFQAAYTTWQPQHWKTVWEKVRNTDGDSSMNLALDYGYRDGWIHADFCESGSTLSMMVLAGKQVENNERTAGILKYIMPHLGASLKDAFHPGLAKDREMVRFNLSKREFEILKWINEGKTTWDIATILKRSQRVVKWHVNNLLHKLGALNRPQAVAIALRKGLIE